jgi:DNA replication protein DnaC
MNISATLEKLNTMRMHGFGQAYRNVPESALQEKYTSDELIAHLVDAEYDDKYNRKLSRLIKSSGFKQQVSLEHIDCHHPRNIDRNLILRLQSCDWINKGRDLLIVGATGTGKSFLACAFGMQACINEHKTLYFTASNLLDKLTYAKADGTYFKFLDFIAKAKLLIIDDFGLKKSGCQPMQYAFRCNR